MGFVENKGLRYYTFDTLNAHPVLHGIFTRRGGISPAPWASLNLGGTVGDAREHVVENRRRIFGALDLPVESLHDVWQVHGVRVVTALAPRPLDQEHEQADAIITANPEVTLFMRFADCVPVLLYDPRQQVIGMVHAGWMGTVKKIAAATVSEMQRRFGCEASDILAGIGPSIGPEQYEIGKDVEAQVRWSFPEAAGELLLDRQGKVHLDLWEANRRALMDVGVKQIEKAQISTAVHTEDWYSHRAEKGRTGRFGALLALRGEGHV